MHLIIQHYKTNQPPTRQFPPTKMLLQLTHWMHSTTSSSWSCWSLQCWSLWPFHSLQKRINKNHMESKNKWVKSSMKLWQKIRHFAPRKMANALKTRNCSSFNHQFAGDQLLVSGRVNPSRPQLGLTSENPKFPILIIIEFSSLRCLKRSLRLIEKPSMWWSNEQCYFHDFSTSATQVSGKR